MIWSPQISLDIYEWHIVKEAVMQIKRYMLGMLHSLKEYQWALNMLGWLII